MIRPYRNADIEAILDIWEQASRVAHHFLADEFLAEERQNIRDKYIPAAQTWVWEDGGGPQGFMSLVGFEVGAIFVRPHQHNRGIGRALMDTAFSLHDYLELDVFEANSIGRRFYDRYGFTRVDRYIHDETGQPMLKLHRSNSAGGRRCESG
jgi:putative acetyltransferase